MKTPKPFGHEGCFLLEGLAYWVHWCAWIHFNRKKAKQKHPRASNSLGLMRHGEESGARGRESQRRTGEVFWSFLGGCFSCICPLAFRVLAVFVLRSLFFLGGFGDHISYNILGPCWGNPKLLRRPSLFVYPRLGVFAAIPKNARLRLHRVPKSLDCLPKFFARSGLRWLYAVPCGTTWRVSKTMMSLD